MFVTKGENKKWCYYRNGQKSIIKALAKSMKIELWELGETPPMAFVATLERDGKVTLIGTFSLVGDVYHFFSDDPSKEMDHLFLSRLIVNKPFRSQGVGKYLLSQAEQEANKHGYQEMNLFMLTEEEKLHSYYLKADWQDAEHREWENNDIVIMQREVPTLTNTP